MPLRVFVADSDEVIQQVLTGLIASQPGWQPCGAAIPSDTFVQVGQLKPDVAILDIALLRTQGWSLARQISHGYPTLKFIVTGGLDPMSVGRDVFNAGGLGYVLKANATSDLIAAVRAVQDGRSFFTPRIAESLLQDYLKSEQEGAVKPSLSERERVSLKFLAREAATTLSNEAVRPRRGTIRPGVKYALVALVLVVSAGLGWMNYHDVLEEKFPWIDTILMRPKLKAMPSEVYKGNPETKVWIDTRTGLYYCPGASEYGKTTRGRFAKQRNAQLDEFEPANRKGCD